MNDGQTDEPTTRVWCAHEAQRSGGTLLRSIARDPLKHAAKRRDASMDRPCAVGRTAASSWSEITPVRGTGTLVDVVFTCHARKPQTKQ